MSVHSSDVTRIFGVNMFCISANLETFLCLLGVDGRVKPFEVRERRECEREERGGVKIERREGKRERSEDVMERRGKRVHERIEGRGEKGLKRSKLEKREEKRYKKIIFSTIKKI